MDETTGDYKVATSAKKSPLALIPLRVLTGIARVFQYGARKYARGNWHRANLNDDAIERYYSAALRHIAATQHPNGILDRVSAAALDEESGLPHIDHAICGLMMLRGILMKEGVLPEDPGDGKNPPAR